MRSFRFARTSVETRSISAIKTSFLVSCCLFLVSRFSFDPALTLGLLHPALTLGVAWPRAYAWGCFAPRLRLGFLGTLASVRFRRFVSDGSNLAKQFGQRHARKSFKQCRDLRGHLGQIASDLV